MPGIGYKAKSISEVAFCRNSSKVFKFYCLLFGLFPLFIIATCGTDGVLLMLEILSSIHDDTFYQIINL